MNDTAPEIEEILDSSYQNKTGEEKLLIALGMFETVRKIVLSSLPSNLSERELCKELFLRFYGNEYEENEKKKILLNL